MEELHEGMPSICQYCGNYDIIHDMAIDLGGIDPLCYDCCLKFKITRGNN